MKRIDPPPFNTPIVKARGNYPNHLYIKRDDLIDLALGGNKARKTVYFIQDALSKKCDWMITYGSAQSNHCRVVAAAAAQYGMKCTLILAKPEGEIEQAGNFLLYNIVDAEIVWTEVDRVRETIEQTVEMKRAEGHHPYFIQGGGHGNLGTQAYVDAYGEIVNWQRESGIQFDYIFHASGTGTTQAGLVAGTLLYGTDTGVVGISIARRRERGVPVVLQSVQEYLRERELDFAHIEDRIHFEDRYIGQGYGDAYGEVLHTIKRVAKEEGIFLDPTYTGKAFYGMEQYLDTHKIRNCNVLFIHTGGLPVLFSQWRKFAKEN